MLRKTMAVCAVLCMVLTSAAQAQRRARRPRARPPVLGLKLLTGLSGEVEFDGTGPGFPDPLEFGDRARWDLDPSYGLAVELQFPQGRHLSLGGQLSLLRWNADRASDVGWNRNAIIALSFVPRVRVAANRRVDLYAALPLGIGRDQMDESWNVRLEDAFGLHIGVLVGIQYAAERSVFLLAELGYSLHSFSQDHQIWPGDVQVGIGQVVLDVGVAFGMN